MKRILSLTTAILFIALMAPAFAEMDVPANLQVALFYKIFDFDRSLTEASGQKVVIGIFYNPNNSRSSQAEEEIKENFSELSDRKIGGKRIVIKEITAVEQVHNVDIVYVTPGNDSSISRIIKECYRDKILGISGVEKYAEEGLAIAIELNDQKPKIVINKTGVESSGTKLSSKLLALAQII